MAVRYAELLVGAGVERGLIGPRESDRIWERHLLNCAVVAEGIPEGAALCDVGLRRRPPRPGSGAGPAGSLRAVGGAARTSGRVPPGGGRDARPGAGPSASGLGPRSWTRQAADVVTARAVAPLGEAGQVVPSAGALRRGAARTQRRPGGGRTGRRRIRSATHRRNGVADPADGVGCPRAPDHRGGGDGRRRTCPHHPGDRRRGSEGTAMTAATQAAAKATAMGLGWPDRSRPGRPDRYRRHRRHPGAWPRLARRWQPP